MILIEKKINKITVSKTIPKLETNVNVLSSGFVKKYNNEIHFKHLIS